MQTLVMTKLSVLPKSVATFPIEEVQNTANQLNKNVDKILAISSVTEKPLRMVQNTSSFFGPNVRLRNMPHAWI